MMQNNRFQSGQKDLLSILDWVFQAKRAYDFNVIDAVSEGKQGTKMRPVFIDLVLQVSETKNGSAS